MKSSLSGGHNETFLESSVKQEKKGFFKSKDKSTDGLIPKPDDVRGRWWHEVVRAQAAIPNLKYVVLRCGELYGEGFMEGQILARLVIGEHSLS